MPGNFTTPLFPYVSLITTRSGIDPSDRGANKRVSNKNSRVAAQRGPIAIRGSPRARNDIKRLPAASIHERHLLLLGARVIGSFHDRALKRNAASGYSVVLAFGFHPPPTAQELPNENQSFFDVFARHNALSGFPAFDKDLPYEPSGPWLVYFVGNTRFDYARQKRKFTVPRKSVESRYYYGLRFRGRFPGRSNSFHGNIARKDHRDL